ncbi:transporter [Pedobacter psychrophilus]|uniref:Transporter n=1 Tax=Pedobacter psychrophilus TaxID=1826909 RepID=A0A179DF78_9SPHI|nr:TolC family protein [Pedobacter psychrophilus]OAQ39681.1 transporter [Pedobacter psychrophilus]
MNNYIGKLTIKLSFIILGLIIPFFSWSQTIVKDSLLQKVTLNDAIQYALNSQPTIQQAYLDEKITESTIKTKLADWYPQINFNYNLQHNFLVQTSIIGGNPVQLGVDNTSSAQFTASQNIFNRDALLALNTKGDVLLQSKQNTVNNKINLVVNVSKAFYNVLSTLQQIKISNSNIIRLERSLSDAFNQYEAGITDKIDYKRATITLNNTKANQKSNEVLLKARIEFLKSLMNYPEKEKLNVVYDSLQLENEVFIDTTQNLNVNNRIEFAQLQTQKRLLNANLSYNKWSFLPSIAANGAYNFNYQNNNFGDLYNRNFPNSYAGITLGLPIFQGGKRRENINIAQYWLRRNELDLEVFKNDVNSEYQQALSTYQSNFANYLALKENMSLAKEVYDVVNLQYRSGIKTYLEVIVSETDLRTSQINYFNAVYQLLISKVDVEKALGQIKY